MLGAPPRGSCCKQHIPLCSTPAVRHSHSPQRTPMHRNAPLCTPTTLPSTPFARHTHPPPSNPAPKLTHCPPGTLCGTHTHCLPRPLDGTHTLRIALLLQGTPTCPSPAREVFTYNMIMTILGLYSRLRSGPRSCVHTARHSHQLPSAPPCTALTSAAQHTWC